jgi:hypothetical protein
VEAASRADLFDGHYLRVAWVPLEVMRSGGNPCRFAGSDDLMCAVDPKMHLAREDRDLLLLARMEVRTGNLAVGAKGILNLEHPRCRLEHSQGFAGDRVFEHVSAHWNLDAANAVAEPLRETAASQRAPPESIMPFDARGCASRGARSRVRRPIF